MSNYVEECSECEEDTSGQICGACVRKHEANARQEGHADGLADGTVAGTLEGYQRGRAEATAEVVAWLRREADRYRNYSSIIFDVLVEKIAALEIGEHTAKDKEK